MNYANKHALVLGLGESGLAMALWLLSNGAVVRVADTRQEEAVATRLAALRAAGGQSEFVGGAALSGALCEGMDFVAISPGLSPEIELREILPAAQEKGIPVWGEIELFAQALAGLRESRAYTPKVIAITGTNGKTTVTSLTGMLCQRAGLSVRVAGNISPAALDVLRADMAADTLPQVWVLELSSFQLQSTFSLQADAATVLNITQDHLDWHGSMAAYAAAKARIFGENTIRVLNRDDALTLAMATPTATCVRFGTDRPQRANDYGLTSDNGMQWLSHALPVEDEEMRGRRRKKAAQEVVEAEFVVKQLMPAEALQIRGIHNAANALAALALCRAIDLPLAPLLHGLRDYKGEPHRVELVSVISGVEYYDDSKGTNVGATVAALHGLGFGGRANRLILIAGGVGKGQDFSPMASAVQKYVRTVLLIGRDAPAIRAALQDTGVALMDCASMDAAVQQAGEIAREGDAVLLSPACSSFDMFKDYAHRAAVFVDAVRELGLSRGEVIV
jgi:UDP-N-acetylmuramoylalanine--D-glutamate ligase